MDMYKFGNYICKLREEKNLTQAELASVLDVSDKTVSKWENGQAFPRMETFEKLASALETTVEDIFSASKDGINRICIVNDCFSVIHIDVNNQIYSIKEDECKWIEIDTDTATLGITVELLSDNFYAELDEKDVTQKEKNEFERMQKVVNKFAELVLQVDCTYRVSNVESDSIITVEMDLFDLGDKTGTYYDFLICYPKLVTQETVQIELLHTKGKNKKDVIKKYKKLGLASDLGMGFIPMLILYPIRGLYFKHLCKPNVLKENILNVEAYKEESEKRKNIGCLGGCLMLIVGLVLIFLIHIGSSVLFVSSEKPYLVASDYSSITYQEDVYVRIEELPVYAHETTIWGATIYEDCRMEGLSKWDQTIKEDKVKLYEDDDGRKYLWLIEDYPETVFVEDGEDKDYEDFEEHYVYVCENPES